MSWHTEIVPEPGFQVLLAAIRRRGGIVTRSSPCPAGYRITYVTLD